MTEVTLIKHFAVADYAVVNRGTKYQPWVACWCFRTTPEFTGCKEGDTVKAWWSQGHYFDSEAEALKFAFEKEEDAVSERLKLIHRQVGALLDKTADKIERLENKIDILERKCV